MGAKALAPAEVPFPLLDLVCGNRIVQPKSDGLDEPGLIEMWEVTAGMPA